MTTFFKIEGKSVKEGGKLHMKGFVGGTILRLMVTNKTNYAVNIEAQLH